MAGKIPKRNREAFLNRLTDTYRVFAPVFQDGNLVFSEVVSGKQISWDCRNTKRTPKELFFPQSEALFRFRNGEVIEEEPDEGARVIFGMRPCDAKSMSLLDGVFDSEAFKDPYFVGRRNRTTIISVACVKPQTTCFCTSVGGSPASKEGADVLLFDLEESYLVEILTEKGRKLIEDLGALLTDAQETDLEERDELVEAAIAGMKSDVPIHGLKERLDGMFEDPLWDQIHLKCLGCGVCTYLCPTCHCFDIIDEAVDSKGRRVRSWDSCMYPLFTLQAAGLNPRLSNKERIRQRMMHKFNYSVENYGHALCVGCGRCVRYCPVNLDIRQVIELITKKWMSEH